LPSKISRIAAVENCANACALTAAFASRAYEKMRGSFSDNLHQPFRAKLIKFLVRKYPSIRYMIAHHEYKDKTLPHYKYFRSLNAAYKPYGKIDPGPNFMSKLRKRLEADGVVLEK